jgi:hypothetical protein
MDRRNEILKRGIRVKKTLKTENGFTKKYKTRQGTCDIQIPAEIFAIEFSDNLFSQRCFLVAPILLDINQLTLLLMMIQSFKIDPI